jgi:predicted metalloprotease
MKEDVDKLRVSFNKPLDDANLIISELLLDLNERLKKAEEIIARLVKNVDDNNRDVIARDYRPVDVIRDYKRDML